MKILIWATSLSLAAFELVAPTQGIAQIYKCKTASGSVEFQQTPCASAAVQKKVHVRRHQADEHAIDRLRGERVIVEGIRARERRGATHVGRQQTVRSAQRGSHECAQARSDLKYWKDTEDAFQYRRNKDYARSKAASARRDAHSSCGSRLDVRRYERDLDRGRR